MATAEERMRILRMVEEGKISAEQGAKLLEALREGRRSHVPTPASPRLSGSARWLRVRVTDTTSGRTKATVQIPVALVDAGVKMGAHFAPDVDGVNMTSILEALRSGTTGKIVDVVNEKDDERVEIFVE